MPQKLKRKKINHNRKPHAKPSKPINFHIPVIKTLIDTMEWWQVEHTEVSRLFQIGGGAHLLLRSKWDRNQKRKTKSHIGCQIQKSFSIFWRKPKIKRLKAENPQNAMNTRTENQHFLAQKPKNRSEKKVKTATPKSLILANVELTASWRGWYGRRGWWPSCKNNSR